MRMMRLSLAGTARLALPEGLADFCCYHAASEPAGDAVELLDAGLTDIIKGRRGVPIPEPPVGLPSKSSPCHEALEVE